MNEERSIVGLFLFTVKIMVVAFAHHTYWGVRQIEKLATVFCMTYKGHIRL